MTAEGGAAKANRHPATASSYGVPPLPLHDGLADVGVIHLTGH